MSRIKRYAPKENLSDFQTFIVDTDPNSEYFRITEFKDTLTGGKNGFLIEGSEHLQETTEIKIEITDVDGNPIYFETGVGKPSYFEGVSRVVSIFVYSDTPIGIGRVTILGELKTYVENHVVRDIPDAWRGVYNLKWERNVKINRDLLNSDKVRFYEVPVAHVEEVVKEIYTKEIPEETINGLVNGIAFVSSQRIISDTEEGTEQRLDYSSFDRNIRYKLTITDNSSWVGSMIGSIIEFEGIEDYRPKIVDIVNDKEAFVEPAYELDGKLTSIRNAKFSVTYDDLGNISRVPTDFEAPYAKITFNDIKTFVGSVGRIRVFRRSLSQISDFKLIEEVPVVADELLMDIRSTEDRIYYGRFDSLHETLLGGTGPYAIDTYWRRSDNLTWSTDNSYLFNSIRLDSPTVGWFGTSTVFPDGSGDDEVSISLNEGDEYTISFKLRKYENISKDDYISVYIINESGQRQDIKTFKSNDFLLDRQIISENFISNIDGDISLRFEVLGIGWYISNVSLKAAQERSFSPDSISVIQDAPRTLKKEKFEFRFDFYDINNNYIPVLVTAIAEFEKGSPHTYRHLSIRPRHYFFIFDANGNPKEPTKIIADIIKILIPEPVVFTSGAYDINGNLIPESAYAGMQYPGLLREVTPTSASLYVDDFVGGNPNITVQYIKYRGTAGDLFDSFTISRIDEPPGGLTGLLRLRPRQHVFVFDKQEGPEPITEITIDIDKLLIGGNVNFVSEAYDPDGEYIEPSDFAGSEYPGRLRNITDISATLNVADFTGSNEDVTVQYIRYIGNIGSHRDIFSISRVEHYGSGSGEIDQELFSKNYQTELSPNEYMVRVGDNWFEKRTNSHFRLVLYHYNNEFDTTFDHTFSVTKRRYWVETTSPPGTDHLLRTFRNSFDFTFDRCEWCFEPTVWDETFDMKFGNKPIYLIEPEEGSHLLEF